MVRSKVATDSSRPRTRSVSGRRPAPAAPEIAIISNMNVDFAEFHRKSRPQMINAYRMLLDLHLAEAFAGSYGLTGRKLQYLDDEAFDAPADTDPLPVVKVRGHGRTTLPAVLVPRDSFRSAGHLFGSARDVFWRQFDSVPLVANQYAYLQYDAEIILMREFRDE